MAADAARRKLVGRAGGRRVIVLASPHRQKLVDRWLRDLEGDDVTVVPVAGKAGKAAAEVGNRGTTDAASPARDLQAVVNRVRLISAPDLIVCLVPTADLPRGAKDQFGLFRRLVFDLAPGGSYVQDRTADAKAPGGVSDDRWHVVEQMVARKRRAWKQRAGELARAVEKLVVTPRLVVATKRGRHQIKLREENLEAVLRSREPQLDLSVLETRPGGSFETSAVEHSYGPRIGDRWPNRINYPPLSLRHYQGGVYSGGGALLFTDNSILPDSFRWHLAPELNHPKLKRMAPSVARVRKGFLPKTVLEGDYYYLDCVFSGHFGHLTTEVLSRMWGWHRAKQDNPALKALFHVRPEPGKDGTLERALFTAFGIAESDLVPVPHPVQVRSLVSATPMWHNEDPHYAHPDIRDTWDRMSAGLLDGAPPAQHERIFVSRGPTLTSRRGCRNQDDVERFFADRGYHVFYPEELSLQKQSALFAGARVVAGFGGSAMFNLMHTPRLEALIVLSHNGYVARNEHLYTSLLGGELNYFWSPADVPPPPTGRTRTSFRSSWAFDFENLGDDLARVTAAH